MKPPTYETLLTELDEGILTITINRPEVLNALAPVVIHELRDLVGHVQRATGPGTNWPVRGIILTGSGEKSFIAGADIKAMTAMSPSEADEYTSLAQELTIWLEQLPVPVIAAVNGFALGGGCEFAMACDFIYATSSASFGQPEVHLGLIPGFGGTVRLQQYVGSAMARELIVTGKRIKADEALRIGLVNQVFDSQDALLNGARETLREVCARSPLAVAEAKATIRATASLPNPEALNLELKAFVGMFTTEDMREGTRAFLSKEQPHFTGS